MPPCLHPLRVCAAGRERRRGDGPHRPEWFPVRRDYGMGPVPNRSLASVVLRRGDRPCGHGNRPHRSERLPRRRDCGVGPVPNHRLAAVVLWRGDSPIGKLLGDCLRRRDYSSGSVRVRGDQSRRADSQVLQYFGIDLVGCALTVWNSVLHSFNVRLEVLIFPSGLTGVTGA